ncbi:MAG: hypothetical protein JWN34_644 [Bryobacterales bacterium]|nr:hypothetical protein [Bryobacterales bacterium]
MAAATFQRNIPGLIPCGRFGRIVARVDTLLQVPSEVSIGYRRIAELGFPRFCERDALAQFAVWAWRWGPCQHSDGPVILLDDDFDALLHPGKRAVKIA